MALDSDKLKSIYYQNSHLYSTEERKEIREQIGRQSYLKAKEELRIALLKEQVIAIQLDEIVRKMVLRINLSKDELKLLGFN